MSMTKAYCFCPPLAARQADLMELSNIQSALASLEERFHKLRMLGEQQLQKQESTISELRQQLAESIGHNSSHEKELAALRQKLHHARRAQEELASLLRKERHLFTRLLQLHQ
jgi:septal ring factor EnvC (AmiA/AmiB activator)